jgi:periplasmic protein TonB
MSPITPNPDEVEELESQLRHALKREAAPASLAPNVEARMNGGHAPSGIPHTAPGGMPKTAPVAMPDVTPDGVPHITQNVGPDGVPHISPGILPNTADNISPNTVPDGTPQFVRMQRSELEPHLWNPVVDEPVWTTWLGNLRGMFQRETLPPLVLTSHPVAVVNPFRVKRSPLSSALSVGAHVVIIALIIFLIIEARMHPKPVPPKPQVAAVDITPFRPIAPKGPAMGGGGGGGAHELVQAPKGRLPKFSETPITPPMLAVNEHPKLAVEPTIKMPPNVVLPNNALPNLGDPRTNIVGPASNGTGSGAGLGSGDGGGIGSGSGAGYGPGEGGGYGGGLYHVGGGVSPPVLIYSVDAEFSDEARRAKYQGVSVVSLIVDAHGLPQRIRVVRKLGMGLDEKAVEAVKQYKFKPSMYQGKPVPVEITVEVNFHIY